MEGTDDGNKLCIRDLLCPQLYQHLCVSIRPYISASSSSSDALLNNLLLPPPVTTLRVNTLRCMDTSVALAEAERCLALKGEIHPKFPDILVFPRQQQTGTKQNIMQKGLVTSDPLGAPFPAAQDSPVSCRPAENSSMGASPDADGNVGMFAGAPKGAPMVIVGPQCGQAVLRGSHVFAPGVLAAERGIKEGAMVGVWAVPRPFRGSYLNEDSKKAVKKWGVFCGIGIIAQPLKDVFLNSKGIAIRMQGACDLSSLPPSLVPQHLPSALVGHVLSPLPGEKVLDLCAAPGHKTSHLAALMRNDGVLVAIDRSHRRLEETRALLARLGATMVECVHADSTKDKWRCSLGNAPDLRGKFDRVLADVTCTGLGLRPRIVYDDVDIHSVKEAASYQRKFLEKGSELLRSGGVLVYSTCSISWQENEGNIEWALENLPVELEPAEPFYSRSMEQGCMVDTPKWARLTQRFCPSGETIGFFIAKFRKK